MGSVFMSRFFRHFIQPRLERGWILGRLAQVAVAKVSTQLVGIWEPKAECERYIVVVYGPSGDHDPRMGQCAGSSHLSSSTFQDDRDLQPREQVAQLQAAVGGFDEFAS